MKCSDCQKNKPDVADRECPYAAEISGENVRVTICDNCCHERAMDI